MQERAFGAVQCGVADEPVETVFGFGVGQPVAELAAASPSTSRPGPRSATALVTSIPAASRLPPRSRAHRTRPELEPAQERRHRTGSAATGRADQADCEAVLVLAEVKETWDCYPSEDQWDDHGYYHGPLVPPGRRGDVATGTGLRGSGRGVGVMEPHPDKIAVRGGLTVPGCRFSQIRLRSAPSGSGTAKSARDRGGRGNRLSRHSDELADSLSAASSGLGPAARLAVMPSAITELSNSTHAPAIIVGRIAVTNPDT